MRQQLAGRHGDVFGVAAARQQRADFLPGDQSLTSSPTASMTPETSMPSSSLAPGGGG